MHQRGRPQKISKVTVTPAVTRASEELGKVGHHVIQIHALRVARRIEALKKMPEYTPMKANTLKIIRNGMLVMAKKVWIRPPFVGKEIPEAAMLDAIKDWAGKAAKEQTGAFHREKSQIKRDALRGMDKYRYVRKWTPKVVFVAGTCDCKEIDKNAKKKTGRGSGRSRIMAKLKKSRMPSWKLWKAKRKQIAWS